MIGRYKIYIAKYPYLYTRVGSRTCLLFQNRL